MHSPEPWRRFEEDHELPVAFKYDNVTPSVTCPVCIVDAKGEPVCPDNAWIPTGWNVERIVACVNACQGWTTEELTDRAFLRTGMVTLCGMPGAGRPIALLGKPVTVLASDEEWKAKAQECKEAVKNAPHGEIFGTAVSDSQPGPDGSHRVWVTLSHTEPIEEVAKKYRLNPDDLQHPIPYGD